MRFKIEKLKFVILLVFIIFLLSLFSVSSLILTKTYDKETKTITLYVNGNPKVNVTLITPLHNWVGVSDDEQVAEILINSQVSVNLSDFFGKIDFYDKLGNLHARDFTWKVKNNDNWINLTKTILSKNNLSVGYTTIGLFTKTTEGETTEWKPLFYNLLIEEWTDFTAYTRYEWLTNAPNSETGTISDTQWQAIPFRIGTTGANVSFTLKGVSIPLIDLLSTGGNVTVAIYNTNASWAPTTSIVSNTTVNNIQHPTLTWINVTMPATTLTKGEKYAIVISTVLTSHTWRMGSNSGNPYSQGYLIQSTDSGSTWTYVDTAVDYGFEVYGLDLVPPDINITYPINNSKFTNNNIRINYTVSDTNLQAVWWTNNSGTTNWTLSNGVNITNQTWGDGASTTIIYANDTGGRINSSAVTFNIDTILPVINITYPLNSSYNINISILNYTYIETNPSSCWYSINNGTTNSTGVIAGINFSSVTSLEGSNNWTLYCNDTFTNNISTSLTFFKDTVKPLLTINSPANATTISALTFEINITANDTANALQYCYFNITRGASLEVSNTQISNCQNSSATLSSGEIVTYTLNVFVNDTLNNINATSSTFTVSISEAGGGGGGGGGTTIVNVPINETSLKICGNNVCDGEETFYSCPVDCAGGGIFDTFILNCFSEKPEEKQLCAWYQGSFLVYSAIFIGLLILINIIFFVTKKRKIKKQYTITKPVK